jgi:hypothetical protein
MKQPLTFLAVISSFIIHHSSFAQGSLTPPGAPTATMRSLDQIYNRGDARTPITNASSIVTLSAPGSYYLTTNLTVSSGNGININTSGVTLDLNGWTIKSTAASATGNGIQLNSGLQNITITSGFIQGGVTNDGANVFSGPGFGNGITFLSTSPRNIRVSGITVLGCLTNGINLNFGDATMVESCCVHTIGKQGISASTVRSCVATECGTFGINADQVSDSRGESVATNSSAGIEAEVVLNSFGTSVGGTGITALKTVSNSSGTSTSGTGIDTTVALGCYASSASAKNMVATIANSCSVGTSNSIVNKYNMP